MTIDGKNVSSTAIKLANGKTATVTVTVTWNKKPMTSRLTVKATIKVKAQSGATRVYTVTITRAKSTNANLTLLKVSDGR